MGAVVPAHDSGACRLLWQRRHGAATRAARGGYRLSALASSGATSRSTSVRRRQQEDCRRTRKDDCRRQSPRNRPRRRRRRPCRQWPRRRHWRRRRQILHHRRRPVRRLGQAPSHRRAPSTTLCPRGGEGVMGGGRKRESEGVGEGRGGAKGWARALAVREHGRLCTILVGLWTDGAT